MRRSTRLGPGTRLERAKARNRRIPHTWSARRMIFIDTNVFMYAVGKPHPLRPRALDFFSESLLNVETLWTSVGVLQELMDLYLPVRGYDAFPGCPGYDQSERGWRFGRWKRRT